MNYLPCRLHAVLAVIFILGSTAATAANITVNTTNDDTIADDDLCTLREAINNANSTIGDTTLGDCAAGTNGGSDTILFTGVDNGTINLSAGQLPNITESTTITGPIAGNPNGITVDALNISRVMEMSLAPGGGGGTLTLNNLTLTNGSTTGGGERGGALLVSFADLVMNDSAVTNSSTAGNGATGGGIAVRVGSATITGSTISGNSTTGNDAGGGGPFTQGGATISTSTISGNTVMGTDSDGAGIRTVDGDVEATNTTISNNSILGISAGAGLSSAEAGFTLNHVTLADNSSPQNSILDPGVDATVIINNSIIAPTDGNACSAPITTPPSANNLFADASCDGVTTPRDGTGGINIAPLANNGGNTETHALCIANNDPVAACTAPSAALNTAAAGLVIDQRGILRPQGAANDIGAYEALPLDYGDAPDPTYPTLAASNGASHAIDLNGPRLGTLIDGEGDGQPNATATGDDGAGQDDEDGLISTTALVPGSVAMVEIFVSQADGLIDAWIDFNADGDWNDAGEQVLTSENGIANISNTYGFNVPADAVLGPTFARIRINSATALLPTGMASDGEVEDYPAFIGAIDDDDDIFDDDDEENCGSRAFFFCIGSSAPLEIFTLSGLALIALFRRIKIMDQ